MAITIKKIAELAGVSAGTVDRALYDRGRVKPEVAARIKQIAESLNYEPNKAARLLSNTKKNLKIAVILHTDHNPFLNQVIYGINKASKETTANGIPVTIFPGKDFDAEYQLNTIKKTIKLDYNAIVIIPIENEIIKKELNRLKTEKFPVFLLTNIISETNYCEYFGCDYYQAGNLMAGLLNIIASSYDKKIAYITPSFRMLGHSLRYKGFLNNDFFKKNSSINHELLEIVAEDNIEVYKQTYNFLSKNKDIDIVIATSGQLEAGCFKAIEDVIFEKKIKILAFDCTDKIQTKIIEKKIIASIDQSPKEQGYAAVNSAFNSLITSVYPNNKNSFTSLRIIIKENLMTHGDKTIEL